MNLQNANSMKKCTTILLILCLFRTFGACASNNRCNQYEGRPMPDWVIGATPEPHNNSYYYKVFEGAHSDREAARNQAVKKAFQQAMTFISVGVKADDVFAAIDREGYNLNVISETFSIPIYFTCEFAKRTPDGTKWVYWILCQIAVRGNIIPQFDTHFSDCNTHNIWDKEKKDCEKEIAKYNGRSLAASTFIPGMGQMLKKQGGSGTAFLLSELAVFGGGAACYYLGKQQTKKMNSFGISYDEYKSAANMKNIMNIAMYTCFGVGAAIHISNMVHAWYVKDKNLPVHVTFVPAIIPINELSNPSYAMGAGVQITF